MTALSVVASTEAEVNAPLQEYVEANPVSVLLDDNLRARFFAEIEAKLGEFQPDLSTDKGRKTVGSFARQYVTTKTAIDAAGKKMNEEARARIDAVDAVRREVRERLDDMRDRARAPLTKWEEKEKERKEKIAAVLDLLSTAPVVLATDTSETIAARLAQVEAVPDEEVYAKGKDTALTALRAAHERILQDEADRAELSRLRVEKEKRDREEAERLAAEKQAADERAAAERRAAEEAARKERAEQEAKEREEAAALRAAAEAEARAKAAAQAEIDRLAAQKAALEKAEAERIAEERRKAAEEEKRQSSIRHRSAVMKAAKEGLMKQCGLTEDTAKAIVTAITQGLIPNVTVNF